jgi:hypothetical protein
MQTQRIKLEALEVESFDTGPSEQRDALAKGNMASCTGGIACSHCCAFPTCTCP